MTTTNVIEPTVARAGDRSRPNEIWRIVRLHAVTPSVFFGIPWLILGSAWAVTVVIALIISSAGGSAEDLEGMRYSWAVVSPQWYLVAVGVQAVGLTLSFALGFGATRRDFWLGTSLMFVLVALMFAVSIATLVQLEIATNGWGVGAHMFNALWYGQTNWFVDFYTTLALQLMVLFLGASVTTVFLRWRMRGMMTLLFGSILVLLALVASFTWTNSWPAVFEWFATIGLVGTFTVVLVLAAVCAIGGYLVIRRATPR